MTGRPEFSPLPPDAPKEDRIGTAMWSMGAAAAAGVVWFCALLLVVLKMQPEVAPATIQQVDRNAAYVNLLAYGAMLGVGFIGVCAWFLLAPIPSLYRRGALSLVTALGGWCIAMGATFIAREIGGSGGLIGLIALAIVAALFLRRRAILSMDA